MNLRGMIDSEGGGAIVQQMASQLGIGEADARRAMDSLLPALGRGLQRNASSGGLDSLIGALAGGAHDHYVDRPQDLARPQTVADGNAILGHILGSKDVSRNVAGRAAGETGLAAGMLKQMLPLLASAVMGALSKQTRSGGSLGGLTQGAQQQQRGGSSALDMLGSFLDSDGDGSAMDDVLNMARKFF